jgi:hypothetical protein
MDSHRRFVWVMALVLVASAAAHERPPFEVPGVNERYELVVPVVTTAPVVDGKLDEPVWSQAAQAKIVRQVSPSLGQPASLPTTVLVLATTDKLFVGFRCPIASKDAIRAYETRYDAPMRNDERVSIFLDTLHTHDRAYEFTVNARGTRADSRFGNERWDAQWEAAVQVGETEWTLEIAIPFAILTYDPRQTVWGINFARFISDREEWTLWAFHPDRPWDLRYMPHLVGLPLTQKRNNDGPRWLLKAFSVADHTFGDGGSIGNHYGLDGEWAWRQNLALRFVVKPDFSEVEEAFESIDVSYVEQFVPDRREFFVQGSEFFSEVAVAREGWRRGSDPNLFFSRRIQRFDVGMKVTGVMGDKRLGFLSAHNFGDHEHSFVVNVAQTFGTRGRAYLGYVDALRPASFHRGLLLGGEWRFGGQGRFSLRGSYARHFSSDDQRDGGAGSLRLSYGDERWFVSLGWTAFSPNFRPFLGYTPRTDFKRFSLFAHRSFRPRNSNAYREANLSVYWRRGETFGGRFFDHNYGISGSITLRDLTEVSLGWERNRHAEYHIRPEPFDDHSLRIGIDFGGNRPFRGDIGYTIGRAFDGRYRQPFIALRWDKPDGSWRFRLEISQRHQTFGDGSRQTVRSREISLTRILSADKWLVLRYFHRSGDFTIKNFALSFRLKRQSGEELYLIWGDPRARQTRNRLIVKWIMPFRF